MIYSMTAFARSEQEENWGHLICEMRAINHRYLETNIYLPDILRSVEISIREKIRLAIQRGKIDCFIKYQPNKAAHQFLKLNQNLVKELCYFSEQIGGCFAQAASFSATDILNFPGVLETNQTDVAVLQETVYCLIEKTLEELLSERAREGKALEKIFLHRMHLLDNELKKVESRLPFVLVETREKLEKRFQEAKLELDSNRLEQEMLLFAQKLDVTEEVDRIKVHVAEIRRVLSEHNIVGRRLDFLIQELNREINTLGSKSSDITVTHCAVEMKVIIEQVREQVQNVE
jgi:uncharacterized protein (TIGR00255 family)